MTEVRLIEVGREEDGLRLDRWFRRHYPDLSHIRLEKLLRTGQVRVDGGRVKSGHRLGSGMTVRVPPLGEPTKPAAVKREAPKPRPRDLEALVERVIYCDDDVLAIDKPAGLAVQGGTGMTRHLDGMLDALRFDAADRPRLVHRLDKDTSGVLLLGRSAHAAAWLAKAFREKTARKTYWALVVGVPRPHRGRIDMEVTKAGGDEADARDAVTYYAVVEQAAQKAAFLALLPLTGRTHQLRVHCAGIGTPIVGDGKYGGAKALLPGLETARHLHLHARSIALRRPGGGLIEVTAPLPPHMVTSWDFFELPKDLAEDPFAELDLD
jgi:23S rRNA pseudouridine955/2504/2580 synthase